jgi:excisionase family DNA binding protein
MAQDRILYSKREAANLLSVSLRTFENLIATKQLPVCRIGRRVLISEEALSSFAAKVATCPNVQPSRAES